MRRQVEPSFLFNRFSSKSISMRLRLFFFLLVLVLTMMAGIIVILLVTGTFSAGLKESKQLLSRELKYVSQDISLQYGQLSVQAVDFSKQLSSQIEEYLNTKQQNINELSETPEHIEELITSLYQNTYFYLEKSNCSGAFVILDTTVNPALENSENSKAGLYLKNLEPNIISSSSPNTTLLRGFFSIGRENSLNLHTQWRMEFDVSEADYYHIPMEEARKNPRLPISKLYYWSNPMIIPDTSEEVMICCVPLIDSKNNIYGVCGLEISMMLFKLSHMPTNNTYPRMFCMFSRLTDNRLSIENSMLAGGYSIKDFSEENTFLKITENSKSYNNYQSDEGRIYLGYHTQTQLYPNGSPYSQHNWVTAVLVPKEDIVNSITRLNIILVCLLCLLITNGIIISIIFSNKYLKPISEGLEMLRTENSSELAKTNVQEIDELIEYLAVYKNELQQKAEQEKHQITILEQFIEKTKTLTPAERSVFNLYSKGLSAQEIASTLFLSINTIKTHTKHIFAKLGVASREELLLYISMLEDIGLEMNP
jgi:DNA-binding CsgD family transcriptional regulator